MEQTEAAKQICLERDAYRCRHCGSADDLGVFKLIEREGRLSLQLSNLITLCKHCYKASCTNIQNYNKNRVGVLLCGGRGTRLFPITRTQNKHTLAIGRIPMVFYPLKTLRAFGVCKTLVVLDREGADSIIKMLGSGKEFGMDISYKVQEGAGGIAEALYLAKDFVRPQDEMVVILGDNVFDIDTLDTQVDFKYDNQYEEYKYKACVYLKQVSEPEAYGVAVLEDQDKRTKIVSRIVEKPKTFVSDLAVVGLYVYTHDVFRVIETIRPSARGELEISSVNDHYATHGGLLYKEVNGYWSDCGGSIQRYAETSVYGAKKAQVSLEEMQGFITNIFDEK
jgi:glucose-1-phosphate thymidylyltransferase